jgi:hypothetical protein
VEFCVIHKLHIHRMRPGAAEGCVTDTKIVLCGLFLCAVAVDARTFCCATQHGAVHQMGAGVLRASSHSLSSFCRLATVHRAAANSETRKIARQADVSRLAGAARENKGPL